MAFVERALLGNDLKALGQGFGFLAAMGFHHADHDIDAFQPPPAALGEHLEGLAHARRRAQENLELAAAFLFGLLQKRFRRGAVIGGVGLPSLKSSSAAAGLAWRPAPC